MPSDLASYEPPMIDQDTSEILSNIAQRIENYEQKVMELRAKEKIRMKDKYDSENKTKTVMHKVGTKSL